MSNIVVSGTGFASLSALIQQYYMPVLYDQIFKKSHPVLALLKAKAKTFNGRSIVVPLEYADGGLSSWGDQHTIGSSLSPAKADIAKTASFTPTMLTGHFLLTKEETLLMDSPQAIKNIVGAKVKNLQKGLEQTVAENLFAVTQTADAFHPLGTLLSDSDSFDIGGIDVSTDTWFKTPVLDNTDFADETSSLITEDNMIDSTKDTYILRLLQKGVANARGYTGENPDIVVCPQFIYDLIENELDPRKTGSKMSERMGSMGFTGLNFRGIDIVADQDMVNAQSNDTDGRIYFINTNYLYMFFNSGAKFTASDMIEDTKSNTFVQKVHTYGNMVVTNRRAHCVIHDIASPRAYAPYVGGA
jgi:hypothetical protein